MKDLNFAEMIAGERRKRGVTQEELAAHLGVGKAAVSKWETGVSYPDIALLPLLASYFDISIDDLMGYTPQLPAEKTRTLLQQLAADFSQKPLEEVLDSCEDIIKKYYSCYPLIYKMAVLYLNNAKNENMLRRAITLCRRVIKNSNNQQKIWAAMNVQAMCHLQLKEGQEVLDLLSESLTESLPKRTLIAQAHLLLGDEEKAEEVMQIDIFLKFMEIFDAFIAYLESVIEDLEKAEPIFNRLMLLAESFNIRHINASHLITLQFLGARMFSLGGKEDKAIQCLEKCADVYLNHFFPAAIRADSFFNKLDSFIASNIMLVPQSAEAIQNEIMQHFKDPVFESLYKRADYQLIIKRVGNL